MVEENLGETPVLKTAPAKPVRKRRRVILTALLALLVLAALGLGVVALGIYRLGWQGQFVRNMEAAFPYPVAVVNWRIITIDDYESRFDAFKKAITYNQAFDFSDPKNAELVAQQKSELLTRLVDLSLEEQLAKKAGVSVTSADIENELNSIALQSGIEPGSLDQVLEKVYGWTRQDFLRYIVMPQLYEKKLQAWVISDKTENAQAFGKAKEVQDKLAAGADFAEIAKEYSDDTTSKTLGGDLGWAPKGTFVKEFEDAAFNLADGKVSDIVVTPFGLHIVQLLGKNMDKDGKEIFHTRHILLAGVKFSDWLNERRDKAIIWKFQVN